MTKTELEGPTAAKTLMTLDDLDFVAASGKVFKSPFKHPTKGVECGVVLHIIGDESEVVQAHERELINEQRTVAAQRAAAAGEAAALSGKRPEPVVRTIEDDIDAMLKKAAIRLVGWDGIAEAWSPAAALRLVSRNESARAQVMGDAGKVANFL